MLPYGDEVGLVKLVFVADGSVATPGLFNESL